MFFLTSTLAINPEIDKQSLLMRNRPIAVYRFQNEEPALKNIYHHISIEKNSDDDFIRNHLLQFHNSLDNCISDDVLKNCFLFIDNIYPSILSEIDIKNIYKTDYGTVVFDWEKDKDNVFSIEIGAHKIGYFIEINGRDEKQVDEVDLLNSRIEIYSELSNFLHI